MLNYTWPASNATSYDKNITTANKTVEGVLTKSEITAMQLCHGFLGTIGFLENLGVIFVILLNRMLLDFPANWFVVSLAISDAITCAIINIVVNIYIIAGLNLEVLVMVFRFVALASANNLFILTFNRFLSVHNSLRYPAIMTTFRAKCLVLIGWIIAFLLSPVYELLHWAKLSQLSYIVGTYYSALITAITSLNIYIVRQARSKRKQIEQVEMQVLGTKTTSSTREYLLAIRLVIMFLTFLASTIPLMVLVQAYNNEKSRRSVSVHRHFVWCIVAMELNSIIDPFIYTVNHPVFRKYLHKVRNGISLGNL